MDLNKVTVPNIYKTSQDFRFLLNWFIECIDKIRYDTENFTDLLDPMRCPSKLLWMLADTMGFKYDDRVYPAVNRLILLYFMSMIRNRGSRDGMILAAETNLAQFIVNSAVEQDREDSGLSHSILENRLDNTSIPVNSVYVNAHVEEGYIDVVYFSDRVPIDTCIEYVRPVGMYVSQSAGVKYDARTKISVDPKLTNQEYMNTKISPTHVGIYRRSDYASLQAYTEDTHRPILRDPVYFRNVKYEQDPADIGTIDPGLRSLYSLQLSNNEQVVLALLSDINKVFDVGDYLDSAASEIKQITDPEYLKNERNLIYRPGADSADGYPDAGVVQIPGYPNQPVTLPKLGDVMTSLGSAIDTDE